jgi:hypothetical protein
MPPTPRHCKRVAGRGGGVPAPPRPPEARPLSPPTSNMYCRLGTSIGMMNCALDRRYMAELQRSAATTSARGLPSLRTAMYTCVRERKRVCVHVCVCACARVHEVHRGGPPSANGRGRLHHIRPCARTHLEAGPQACHAEAHVQVGRGGEGGRALQGGGAGRLVGQGGRLEGCCRAMGISCAWAGGQPWGS